MRVLVEAGPAVTKRTRHTEVNEQNAIGFEPDNQILAATLDRRDPLALELRRHLGRLVGSYEPRIVNLDPLEATARQHGLELSANGLDLGQLGHAAALR